MDLQRMCVVVGVLVLGGVLSGWGAAASGGSGGTGAGVSAGSAIAVNTARYSPEELIVAFSSPQTDEKVALKVEKFFGKMSGKRHRIASDYSRSGLPNTYLLKLSPGDDPLQVAEKYLQDPEVLYVEPNYEVNIATVPDDTSFASLWGLHNTGQRGTADSDIDAPEAWDICTGSREVVVAVVDTGVDYTHPGPRCEYLDEPRRSSGERDR